MEYERLWAIADLARVGRRLAAADSAFIRDAAPAALAAFPDMPLPQRLRHPAGFPVSGAPLRTFVQSALLLAGQKAFGRKYEGAEFYQRIEKDLAFAIMRSHFHHAYPKGAHCCAQCSLAVLPVLEASAIRYFDCAALAPGLRRLIEQRQWRFAGARNPAMLAWALSGPDAKD